MYSFKKDKLAFEFLSANQVNSLNTNWIENRHTTTSSK